MGVYVIGCCLSLQWLWLFAILTMGGSIGFAICCDSSGFDCKLI